MLLVAAGTLIAYLITFFLMPFIIRIARRNKLYDLPDERKTHKYPISSLGGVGIVAGLSISLLLVTDFTIGDSEFQYYLASIFIVFILGVIDDIFVLKAWKKVLGQIVIACLLTTKAHLLITNFQGIAGLSELNNAFSYILTFFTIILVINSFNLIDGIDGLAGMLGLASSFSFGLFFFLNNNLPYAILGFSMSGAVIAFLMFNFPPARIFMGDSGSMLIGLVNAILLIKFVETAGAASVFSVSSALAVGFGVLLIPLLDVLRVFLIRLTKGVSPFAPDRNHLHHLLLNKGFSHTKVTLTLFMAALCFSALSFYLMSLHVNINIIAFTLILLFFSGVFVIKYFAVPPQHLHVVNADEIAANLQDTRVLSMYAQNESVALKDE